MIVLFLSMEKTYGQERFCKICSHLYLFGKRCKLEVLNFEVKILLYIILSTVFININIVSLLVYNRVVKLV